PSARLKNRGHVRDNGGQVANVFQGLRAQNRVEAVSSKRETSEISNDVDVPIVPGSVTNGAVARDIVAVCKGEGIRAFSGPRIKDACIRFYFPRPLSDEFVDQNSRRAIPSAKRDGSSHFRRDLAA